MHDYREFAPVDDHEAKLELALMDEYLHLQGHHLKELAGLEAPERVRLLHGAAIYAAGKLAEIEARAHYVEDLHYRE